MAFTRELHRLVDRTYRFAVIDHIIALDFMEMAPGTVSCYSGMDFQTTFMLCTTFPSVPHTSLAVSISQIPTLPITLTSLLR